MLSSQIIGNKIAEARKKQNFSQAQLAERLFISAQAVGKWERGESLPDIIMLNRLAEIAGVDLNYFSENFQSTTIAATTSATAENRDPVTEEKEKNENLSWNMSRGNWAGADFSGLKNLHEKFSASNMQNCKFAGSDLAGLLLRGNNVSRCDFAGSDFKGSRISASNLENNQFPQCSLREAHFTASHLKGCDFTGADFTSVLFKNGGIEKCNLQNAVWNHTTFNASYLADLVFEGNVNDCYFENCSFNRITFQNAVLTNTFFKCRSLKRLRFIDCKADRMTYEFLKNGKADLTGITMITS